ncbi:antitoxin [Rhodococcus sp. IEGM 1408]|uniref:antitoxin n=1 Tax=Rhodococcus sp. IEGM 1408 TaxID=3082220 RepID=UPI002952B011|nr:Rv0909 family putative TA system antitoxin [Rhodococcus sp. IEGM 1408]MDV7999667.1 Rv0909 family putative TA system antitoxin [Rhodococcus sp. IEGM 1408]
MSFINKIKDFAAKNPDKVNAAVNKAGDLFDQRTGGKHAKHTDTAQEKAGEFLTGRKADGPGSTTDATRSANPAATPPVTPTDAPDAGRPPTGGPSPA